MRIVQHYQLHCFNFISIFFTVTPPPAKRPKTLEYDSPQPPLCAKSPSDLDANDLKKCEMAPPYYHWMALYLRDKFTDDPHEIKFTLDDVEVDVPTQALDTVIEQFGLVPDKEWENEYELTSQVNRYLDRFYFNDAQVKEGAVLAQYPLQGTRRGDSCIVLYGEDWKIKHPVLGVNDSKLATSKLPKAVQESRLYSLCAVSVCESDSKFPYIFSFPICGSSIELEMHIVVNQKLHCIEICKASFHKADELKGFFILTNAIVRWANKRNSERCSSVPLGIMPKKGLELFDKFNDRNVFLKDSKVYKFFLNDGYKHPNIELMKSLDIKNVELVKLSKEYSLLSYSYIDGGLKPVFIEQIMVLAERLECVHKKGLVHGDVREGNLIFGQTKDVAYLIDFDYTTKVGEKYPIRYNSNVKERHVGAKGGYQMTCDHDWYSLIYIMTVYFDDFTAIRGTSLEKHLQKHKNACLAAQAP